MKSSSTPAAMEQMQLEEHRSVPELARVDGGWGAWTYLTAATGLEVRPCAISLTARLSYGVSWKSMER